MAYKYNGPIPRLKCESAVTSANGRKVKREEEEDLLHTKFSSFHMVHMIEIVRQGKVDFPQVIVSGL